MRFLILGGLFFLLVGFVLGYVLSVWALLFITVVAICFSGYLLIKTLKEISAVIAYIITVILSVGCISMWLTHYLAVEQSWSIVFVQQYFLRQ